MACIDLAVSHRQSDRFRHFLLNTIISTKHTLDDDDVNGVM